MIVNRCLGSIDILYYQNKINVNSPINASEWAKKKKHCYYYCQIYRQIKVHDHISRERNGEWQRAAAVK